MTDKIIFSGTEEGQIVPDDSVSPSADHALVIAGLTKEQFDVLSEGVARSLREDPRNKTAKFAGKAALIGVTMVFLAACVWTVAQILTPLTNR